jgi:hypothetical protein
MAWRRIDKDHWQNDNDRHLFFDTDRKTVCTEAWTEHGVAMVVIPVDTLREFLKENRYPSFTEVEFLAIGRRYDEGLATARKTDDDILEYKAKLKEKRKQLKELESKYLENLTVLELANEVIQKKADRKEAFDLQLSRVIKAGQAEVTKLREEVKRLKDKYEQESKD